MTTTNISSILGEYYTWNTSPFIWDSQVSEKIWNNSSPFIFSADIDETLFLSDNIINQLVLLKKENLHFSEKVIKVSNLIVKQYLGLAETYVDNISFILKVLESFMLSDNLSKEIIVPKMGNESFDINEKGYREVAILNKEQFNLLDKISSAILFVINEYASFEEKQLIDYQTVRKENLRIADKRPSFDFDCLYSESVNVVEFYKDLISFLLLVTESLGIIEASAKDYNLNKFENLLAEELKQYNNVTKLSKEPINFAENLDRSLSFLRVFNEYVTMSEKPIKNINKRSYEVFSLLDAYLRNANAIISDVVIKNFEMTFIDFDNTDIPAGFSSFKDLITGEYTYEKAMLKLVLGAEINANRPNIQRFELNVDVEDVVDRGSVYIPAGDASQPVRVYFNKSFNIVPEVGIYLKGGTDINAKPFIVGVITLEYFDVELKVNETYVAGTVGWQAIGY